MFYLSGLVRTFIGTNGEEEEEEEEEEVKLNGRRVVRVAAPLRTDRKFLLLLFWSLSVNVMICLCRLVL